MSDLISRQDAIEIVSEECFEFRGMFARIKEKINNLPSAQPERKQGEWIDDGTELGCCCSECGTTLDDYFDGLLHEICLSKIPNFCPSCGSYNGGEEDEIAERKKESGYTAFAIFLLEINARNVAKNMRGEQE